LDVSKSWAHEIFLADYVIIVPINPMKERRILKFQGSVRQVVDGLKGSWLDLYNYLRLLLQTGILSLEKPDILVIPDRKPYVTSQIAGRAGIV
jgi:hypothetical protein